VCRFSLHLSALLNNDPTALCAGEEHGKKNYQGVPLGEEEELLRGVRVKKTLKTKVSYPLFPDGRKRGHKQDLPAEK
jgi:hypothetical protein